MRDVLTRLQRSQFWDGWQSHLEQEVARLRFRTYDKKWLKGIAEEPVSTLIVAFTRACEFTPVGEDDGL